MPGGRPPKPIQLVKGHRTKAEKEVRKKAEEALLTGTSLKEWPDVKAIPVAHKEFLRLRKLLKSISKDDALYEGTINRYCLLLAECKEFAERKLRFEDSVMELEKAKQEGDIDITDYIKTKMNLQKQVLACDKAIMEKRRMMLAIEKENIMTIASALRSIPKKPDENAEESPMAAFLKRRQADKNAT